MKQKKPLPVWIRYVMGPVWGWLVYHSNRRFHGRETWYDIKDRVLNRWGILDGCDLQVLPPKECWSCDKGRPNNCADGSFVRHHADALMQCARCDGHGIYQQERYVRLERKKLGGYVFHKPTRTEIRRYAYEAVADGYVLKEMEFIGGRTAMARVHELIAHDIGRAHWEKQWKPKQVIEGYVRHTPSKRERKLGYYTRIVLELLFDGRRFGPVLLKRVFSKQIYWWKEQRRQWRFGMHAMQRPRWSPWHREEDMHGYLDDDLPF